MTDYGIIDQFKKKSKSFKELGETLNLKPDFERLVNFRMDFG